MPPDCITQLRSTSLINDITRDLIADAEAFAKKDPASGGNVLRIIQTYTSFKAVLHYRLAHSMDDFFLESQQFQDLPLYAALISSRAKLLSGAELHHKCQIGKRFVLDHGVGTVFGETSVVGNDCYILGGVTLGASGISNNPSGKRHPTIGNRVQVGAFARIYGPVTIGNDVFIEPQCTIVSDVEANSRVILRTSLQVISTVEI